MGSQPVQFFIPIAETRHCKSADDVKALAEDSSVARAQTLGLLPPNVEKWPESMAMEIKKCFHPLGYDVTAYLDEQWSAEQLAAEEREQAEREARRRKRMKMPSEKYQQLRKQGLSPCCEKRTFRVQTERRYCFDVYCSECRDYLWFYGPKYL